MNVKDMAVNAKLESEKVDVTLPGKDFSHGSLHIMTQTIREVEDISNLQVNSAYTTIPGKYITIVQNSIVKDAKDKFAGISIKDVASAIIQVRDIEIPEDKVLIDIVPDKFILEDGKPVEDPVGKFSSNFTLTAQIILAEKEYIKQLTSVFKKAVPKDCFSHFTIYSLHIRRRRTYP